MAYDDTKTWEENLAEARGRASVVEADEAEEWTPGAWHGSQGGKVEHFMHSSGKYQILRHPKHGDSHQLMGPQSRKGGNKPLASGTADEMKDLVREMESGGGDEGGGPPPDTTPKPTPTGGRKRTVPGEVSYSMAESLRDDDAGDHDEVAAYNEKKAQEDLGCDPLHEGDDSDDFEISSDGDGYHDSLPYTTTYSHPSGHSIDFHHSEGDKHSEDRYESHVYAPGTSGIDHEPIKKFRGHGEGPLNKAKKFVSSLTKKSQSGTKSRKPPIEEGEAPEESPKPKQEHWTDVFRRGYDHGYSGADYEGGGIYYGAGYREGEGHAKEKKPHHFEGK